MYTAVVSIGNLIAMWFYSIRDYWERLLIPFLREIPSWIKPDHLSCSRAPLGAVVSYFLFIFPIPVLAALIYAFAWMTYVLDGALARYRKQFSRWGIRIDPLVDKIMNVTIFACFIYYRSNDPDFISLKNTLWIIIGTDILTTIMAGLVSYFREIRVQANIFGKWKFGAQCMGGTLLIFKFSLALPVLAVASVLGVMSLLSYSYEGYLRLRD